MNTLQLVDQIEPAVYPRLRAALPHAKLVQVIHIVDEESMVKTEAAAPHVDAVLLDSGNPALAVKELGGTGRTHDWRLSRRIREGIGVPVFLAGGLRAENVGEAVRTVRPFGLDLCSGVRTDGRHDEAKLDAFMQALRRR